MVGDNSRCGELHAPTPPAPLDTVWTQNPDGLESRIGQFEYFVNRVSIRPPNQPVGLAQTLDIPIENNVGKIQRVLVAQRMSGSDASILSYIPTQRQSPAFRPLIGGILRDDGQTQSVEFVPVGLGEETVRIGVSFEDHGYDERYFHLKVVPRDDGLEEIRLDYWNLPNQHPHLTACLLYTQLANCIFLGSLNGLGIRVEQPDKPVLRVDPDGTIHELSPGTATVVVSVGKVQQSLALNVRDPLAP